jgi:hypothetical protein
MTRYFIICMTCTVALSPDEKVGQSLSCVWILSGSEILYNIYLLIYMKYA